MMVFWLVAELLRREACPARRRLHSITAKTPRSINLTYTKLRGCFGS
jgi:hypothetical protein